MISQTSEYALRACLELARRYAEGPVRANDISEALGVPRNYLSKILHALSRDEIVLSTRGPGGGFELAVSPDELVLARIVELFEPDLLRDEGRCILGQNLCSDRTACAAHWRWKEIAGRMKGFFQTTTLTDLAGEGECGKEPDRQPDAGSGAGDRGKPIVNHRANRPSAGGADHGE